MAATTLADDPYPLPFEWADTMPAECEEEKLLGLIPCGFQCEQGLLPLVNGECTICWSCYPDDV